MKKLTQLRQMLTENHLINNPDSLQISIKDGNVIPLTNEKLTYSYRYTFCLTLDEYPLPFDDLITHIISWMNINQPELITNPTLRQQAIKFNAEQITDTHCRLHIELQLTDRIRVEKSEQGLTYHSISDKSPDERYFE